MVSQMVFVGGLGVLLVTSSLQAQGCDIECGATLQSVVTFGARGDSGGVFYDTQGVVRDSKGHYYLQKPGATGRLFVYNTDGSFKQTIGAELKFSNIGAVAISIGDTMHIFDSGTRTYAVLASNYRLIRSSQLKASVNRATLLDNNNVVVNSNVTSSERIGLPLHHLYNGELKRSFGSLTGEFRPNRSFEGWRNVAATDHRTVWASHPTSLRLEQWSVDGSLLKTLSLKLEAFQEWSTGERFSPTSPPKPVLAALRASGNGNLLLIATVPDARWRSNLQVRKSADGVKAIPADWDKVLDSYIVEVDSNSGKVLWAHRDDRHLRSFISDTEVIGVAGNPLNASVSVWRIQRKAGGKQ